MENSEKETKTLHFSLKKIIYPLLLVVAAMIWGFAFSAQKAGEEVPVFQLLCARSFIGSAFLFAVLPLLDKSRKNGRTLYSRRGLDLTRKEWIGGIMCGLVLTLASAFQQFGISGIGAIAEALGIEEAGGSDAGKAAFITALYVVIVPVIGLFFRKKVSVHVWICVALAVVGFYFLCIKDGFTLAFSDLCILGCAIIFAGHILVIDHYSPFVDGVRMSAVQFLTVGVLTLILTLITERGQGLGVLLENVWAVIFLGVFSSGIAYTLQIVGQKHVAPAVASILMSLESVFGVLGGAMFLGERMSAREWIGASVVFLAVIGAQLDFPALFSQRVDRLKK